MQEAGQLDHVCPGSAGVLQRTTNAGEDNVQLLGQSPGVPRDPGQEDKAARGDIAGWDDGRIVLLHGLLGRAPHGPQVHGDGPIRVKVARGNVAGTGGAGLTGENLHALPAAAVARCPIPTPEAGADGVVKGQAMGV